MKQTVEVLHLFRCSTHTHTPPSGVKNWGPGCEVKMRMTGKWKWDEDEDGMKVTKQEHETGNAKKERRNQERTPTPTHLARSGRTLKRQGKRKSGGRRKNTKTSGGGGGRKRLNQPKPQRKQGLPKHTRTKTYLERGSTHEIGDQWGPSWWPTTPKNNGIQSPPRRVARCSHYRTVVDQPTWGRRQLSSLHELGAQLIYLTENTKRTTPAGKGHAWCLACCFVCLQKLELPGKKEVSQQSVWRQGEKMSAP